MTEFGVMALIVYFAIGILVSGFTIGFIHGMEDNPPEPPYLSKLYILVIWPFACPILLMCVIASLVTKAMRKRQV